MNRDLKAALRKSMDTLTPEVDRASAAFVTRAVDSGALDVSYCFVDSPFGPMLAATTRKGLVMLSYDGGVAQLEELSAKVSPRVLEAPLDHVRRQLDEYFDGRRKEFDIPLDLRLTRGFSLKVLQSTARIPFGQVSTYRDVARKAGNAKASRAAGNALGSNPIPIVVPCHRVVRTGGGLGGYTGGLGRKEWLLQLEGALS
jgi:methylated-DNA-[protein]-cysteine S-methyltransferase